VSRGFRRQLGSTADHVGRPLSDREYGRIDIAAEDLGHDGGIHHAQTLDTSHTQVRIHNRRFVATYPACTGCMLDRGRRHTDVGVDVSIGGATRAR
jgi:hypothetical protein